MEALADFETGENAVLVELLPDLHPEVAAWCVVGAALIDAERGLVLALMRQQRGDLGVLEARHVLDVVRDVGLEEEQGPRAVGESSWSEKNSGSRAATSASVTTNPALRWSGCSR